MEGEDIPDLQVKEEEVIVVMAEHKLVIAARGCVPVMVTLAEMGRTEEAAVAEAISGAVVAIGTLEAGGVLLCFLPGGCVLMAAVGPAVITVLLAGTTARYPFRN